MDKVQISLIKQAMDSQDDLTDWENEFIDSLADKEENYQLSEKQNSILNRISQKIL